MMDYLQLIEDLTNAKGMSGFEDEVIEVINKYKGNYTLQVDNLKNCYLNLDQVDPAKPTVMLDSHLDEVGLMVKAIDKDGLILIQTIGGWVPSNLTAQVFYVRNRDGKYYKGISATKPIHFMTPEEREKKIAISDIKIDMGATSREQVVNDLGIEIGQPIVPATKFSYNEVTRTILAKAFDNRIGTACAVAIMRDLADEVGDFPFNLVAAPAAQEEVGTRGASLTVKRVKPNIAIILEGTPADDFTNSKELLQGQLGQGPQIRHRDNSYVANTQLIDLFKQTARAENIPSQHAVREGGGTNAGPIHLGNLGTPCATIGIPSRYAHTNACFCSYDDFLNTIHLVKTFLRRLSLEDIQQFDLMTY
ncbi:M20/M25/M40 family metallo-hydrolase [Aerococcus urinae]|nr:M20/M25/M40 family metallo-hydrolase [Aerococcus urinae]MCY3046673.1 M20/M25/M40 family metallo-hydrolase [Aerococcus urinae]